MVGNNSIDSLQTDKQEKKRIYVFLSVFLERNRLVVPSPFSIIVICHTWLLQHEDLDTLRSLSTRQANNANKTTKFY